MQWSRRRKIHWEEGADSCCLRDGWEDGTPLLKLKMLLFKHKLLAAPVTFQRLCSELLCLGRVQQALHAGEHAPVSGRFPAPP